LLLLLLLLGLTLTLLIVPRLIRRTRSSGPRTLLVVRLRNSIIERRESSHRRIGRM